MSFKTADGEIFDTWSDLDGYVYISISRMVTKLIDGNDLAIVPKTEVFKFSREDAVLFGNDIALCGEQAFDKLREINDQYGTEDENA